MNTKKIVRCNWKIVGILCLLAVLSLATAVLFVTPTKALAKSANSLVLQDGSTPYDDGLVANTFVLEFGAAQSVPMPWLLKNETTEDQFGVTAADFLRFTVIKGEADANGTITYPANKAIGGTRLVRKDWTKIFNKSLPAGIYKLTIYALETSGLVDDTQADDWTFYVKVNAVDCATNPAVKTAYDALIESLSDVSVMCDNVNVHINDLHIIDDDSRTKLAALQEAFDTLASRGSETTNFWAKEIYDDLYEVELVFNTTGMSYIDYGTELEANGWGFNDTNPNIKEAGDHTIYYNLRGNNVTSLIDSTLSAKEYETQRSNFKYVLHITQVLAIPEIPAVEYNGKEQYALIPSNAAFTIKNNNNPAYTDVGKETHPIVLKANYGYVWENSPQTNADRTEVTVYLEIKPTRNAFTALDMLPWDAGHYDPRFLETEADMEMDPIEGTPFVAATLYGTPITFQLINNDGDVVFDSTDPDADYNSVKAGHYILKAIAQGSANFAEEIATTTVQVREHKILEPWVAVVIAVGSALVVIIILLILWKKGVFQILTGKLVIAIRTQATIDATIAAVRASKVAEASKASREAAEARDRAEALRQAREAERAKPAEERAAALEEKAAVAAQRAERMKNRAESLRNNAAKSSKDDAAETTDSTSTEE